MASSSRYICTQDYIIQQCDVMLLVDNRRCYMALAIPSKEPQWHHPTPKVAWLEVLSPNNTCSIRNQTHFGREGSCTEISQGQDKASVQRLYYYRTLESAVIMSLTNQNIIITGASMGIGAAIAKRLAAESANLILFARSEDKLKNIAEECQKVESSIKVHTASVDVSKHDSLRKAVANAVNELGPIDVLINNAGLAVGAPNRFPDLTIDQITTMSGTNINGFMFATYAALNEGKMKERSKGTILNVTSTTGLEVPPFPGEAV